MSGVILALLERPAIAACVLAAARRSAQLMGATRIHVLAIRMPPMDILSAAEGLVMLPDDDTENAGEAARLAALRDIFQAWASGDAAGNLAAEWVELEGWPDQIMDDWGERADLIVLQRPGVPKSDPERRAVHAALFDTGRPVLVVPQAPGLASFGQRIVVAWREDARTQNAVLGALRWLSGAAEMHVVCGLKRWESAPGLPAVFAEHGVRAQLHLLPMSGQKAFGEALLARAHELSADLMVLGAFAHPMLFGPMLGGVTKHMMGNADMPVLMRY